MAEELGCHVDSIDYTDVMSPDDRVERLLGILKKENEDFILAGSSMGGYVSLVASEQANAKAVFLLAPALYMPDYNKQTYVPVEHQYIEIVHGWSDDVIPPEHSIKFAQSSDCSLHLISGDHRLNSSIEAVENIFRQFLAGVLKK